MKKQLFVFAASILLFSCSAKAGNNNNPSKLPGGEKTYAVVVGVLQWTDQYLASFEKRNRKDEELYNLLKTTGTEESNIIFLKDEQATLKSIKDAMKTILDKTTKGSHFIFYYAGHGMH